MDIVKNIGTLIGTDICEKFSPENGCNLPILPGHYGGDMPLVLPIPDLPEMLVDFVIGTWKLKLEYYDESLKELVCMSTSLEFASNVH